MTHREYGREGLYFVLSSFFFFFFSYCVCHFKTMFKSVLKSIFNIISAAGLSKKKTEQFLGEFSLLCCTYMAHAGNTKIWAKIISAHAKKCSITGLSSLWGEGGRGEGGGGGAKNASIYALSGHEKKAI